MKLSIYNNSANLGGGGYCSTGEDISRYMVMHINKGEYNGVRILNSTTIELMHKDIAGSKRAFGWNVQITIGGVDGIKVMTVDLTMVFVQLAL